MSVPPEPQPQNLVQASGRVAEGIIGGFQGAPTLLLIVILNVCFMIVAGYYLLKQDEQRNVIGIELVGLIRACILETAPLRTFDEYPRTGSLGTDIDRSKVDEDYSAGSLEPVPP